MLEQQQLLLQLQLNLDRSVLARREKEGDGREALPHGRVNSLSGDKSPRSSPAASSRPARDPSISPAHVIQNKTEHTPLNHTEDRLKKEEASCLISCQFTVLFATMSRRMHC